MKETRESIDDCTPEEWSKAYPSMDQIKYHELPVLQDKPDVINKPKHYVEDRKFEPWDVIEDWKLNYWAATALKYISRYERKGSEVEDLRKAIAFLTKEIERIEKRRLY